MREVPILSMEYAPTPNEHCDSNALARNNPQWQAIFALFIFLISPVGLHSHIKALSSLCNQIEITGPYFLAPRSFFPGYPRYFAFWKEQTLSSVSLKYYCPIHPLLENPCWQGSLL